MTNPGEMRQVSSHLGGREVAFDEANAFELYSPGRPGEAVARVSPIDADTADRGVDALVAAAAGWAARPAPARGQALAAAAKLLDDRAATIGRDLAREEGKTAGEGEVEVRRSADILRFSAAQAEYEPDGATLPSSDRGNFLQARRVPVGPVTAITPWNFPIAIPAWKIGPALAFGNPVAWKPAEIVPLTSRHFLDALLEGGVDPEAISMFIGRGSEIGSALTTHPGIKAVSFTGSNAVGKHLMGTVGPLGKALQLEMGGKNPAVVLADADVELAARAVANAAFLSAGQKCTATSRVIVDAAIADRFTAELGRIADEMTVGDPLDPATEVGPLSSPAQAETVRSYVRAGLDEGGLVTRRDPDDVPEGPYVAPTVFRDLSPESPVVREEIFGPIAAVLVVDGPDEALAMANDTPFGLTASVFTRDLGLAMRFSDELDVGTVKVNQESTGNDPHLPFGGTGASSAGPSEQGKAAIEFYTKWKSIYIRHS